MTMLMTMHVGSRCRPSSRSLYATMSFTTLLAHHLKTMGFGLLLLILPKSMADSSSTATKPLRVFILAGQSNMEGKGKVDHLHDLLQDGEDSGKYQKLWDASQDTWKTRDDVFVRFLERSGNLTVAPGFANPEDRFGVEVGFGWTVGDSLSSNDEQILLIKTAWGGRALTVEFRPPTSCLEGVLQYPCYYWETCDPYKPVDYGNTYRDMIWNILNTLHNLDKYVPGYTDDTEVTLSGLVWFQAWNDYVDPKKVAEYSSNLKSLIRSVRLDLDTPDLPIVIGELGQHGANFDSMTDQDQIRVKEFRTIQRQVTKLDEFSNTTRFVKTSTYMVTDSPEDETFDGFYHYNGRADTFYSIGEAFGEAMLDLMGETKDIEDEG